MKNLEKDYYYFAANFYMEFVAALHVNVTLRTQCLHPIADPYFGVGLQVRVTLRFRLYCLFGMPEKKHQRVSLNYRKPLTSILKK